MMFRNEQNCSQYGEEDEEDNTTHSNDEKTPQDERIQRKNDDQMTQDERNQTQRAEKLIDFNRDEDFRKDRLMTIENHNPRAKNRQCIQNGITGMDQNDIYDKQSGISKKKILNDSNILLNIREGIEAIEKMNRLLLGPLFMKALRLNLYKQMQQLLRLPSYDEQQLKQAAVNDLSPPPYSESPPPLEMGAKAGDIPAVINHQVGASGGDDGGSSDNSSDSNEDDKENEHTRPSRQGKPKRKGDDVNCKECGCNCHRKPNKPRNDLPGPQGSEKRKPKSKRGDLSAALNQKVGASGGDDGGSSGNSSDSNEDDKENEQTWPGRQGKPSRQRGSGNTHSNDSNTQWTIDTAAWKTCIRSKDTHTIEKLLSEKRLPDNDLLNEAWACKEFEESDIRRICDAICKYIVQKSSQVKRVYPATMVDEATKKKGHHAITFVVIHQEDADLGNDFKFHMKKLQASQENVKIKEEEHKVNCEVGNEFGPNLTTLSKCIQQNAKTLSTNHTNVCRISHSRFKSIRFGKKDAIIKRIDCVVLYVYVKGFIPLGEELLPKKLVFNSQEVLVDVREGYVEVYTGILGPNDPLDHLRMGCSIGGAQHTCTNEKAVIGTLGAIFEFGGADFCICSAHVVLSANEMKLLKVQKTPVLKEIKCEKSVYQPPDNYLMPFGTCQTAVYREGGEKEDVFGVDIAFIKIDNRNPDTGEFPKCDRDRPTGREYTSGKVYTCEEIHNAVTTHANRPFFKYGCGTGWTTGMLRSECASFCAPHPVQDGNTDFGICLHNQFEIYSDTDFAGKSDSGALVFMEYEKELVAVGIVIAGMPEDVCFVTPLDPILNLIYLGPKKGLKKFERHGQGHAQ